MKMFKKIILSILIAGCTSFAAFGAKDSGTAPATAPKADYIKIQLKNGRVLHLPKQVANITKYFNNPTQQAMRTGIETGVKFENFDDNVVELTCSMIKVIYNLRQDQESQAYSNDTKNKMLQDILNHALNNKRTLLKQTDFDINQAWCFADYLDGIPELEQAIMAVLAKNICTPEFLDTFQGNEFLSDDPTNDLTNQKFREQLKEALNKYIKIHQPDVYARIMPYSCSQTLRLRNDSACSLCVTPDGKIVSGSFFGSITIWICNPVNHKYRLLQTLNASIGGLPDPWVLSVCVTPDGKIVSGSGNNIIKIWSYNPETLQYALSQTLDSTVDGHTGCVNCVYITPDGKIVSGSNDNTIKIWTYNPEIHQYTLSQTLNFPFDGPAGHTYCVNCVCITPNGKLVSGLYDNSIKIWAYNGETHQYTTLPQTLDSRVGGHTNSVNSVCVTPDDKILSGSSDSTIKIWSYSPETHQYALSQTLVVGHVGSVENVCVTQDGRIVSALEVPPGWGDIMDSAIKIWSYNTETNQYALSQTLDSTVGGHTSFVRTACITSDGKIVSGANDNTIKIWAAPNLTIEQIIARLKKELVPATQVRQKHKHRTQSSWK